MPIERKGISAAKHWYVEEKQSMEFDAVAYSAGGGRVCVSAHVYGGPPTPLPEFSSSGGRPLTVPIAGNMSTAGNMETRS